MQKTIIRNGHEYPLGEFLYLAALFLHLSYKITYTTMFGECLTNNINSLVRYTVILLIIIKMILCDSFTLKQMCVVFLFLLVSAGTYFLGLGYTDVFALAFLFIGAYNVSFRSIIKLYCFLSIVILLTAFVSSLLGLITNLQYQRGTQIRNSFGVIYPTDFSAHLLFLTLALLFLKKKKIKIVQIIGILAVAWFIQKFCGARNNAICLILSVIVFVYLDYGSSQKIEAISTFVLKYSVCICATIFIGLTLLYSPQNALMQKFNGMVSNRLSFGLERLHSYGLSLFGKKIFMQGFGGRFFDANKGYYFIDCSYLNILVSYGILFFALLMVLVTILCIKKVNKQDFLLPAIFLVVAVTSMMEQHFIEIEYNIFLLSIFSGLFEILPQKTQCFPEKNRIKT